MRTNVSEVNNGMHLYRVLSITSWLREVCAESASPKDARVSEPANEE